MNHISRLTRRTCIIAFAMICEIAVAQKYPDRPIRLVIPYGPGGGTDNLSRAIAPQVSTVLGQPFIIEHRPGGATIIGTEAVVKSAPDGYTLLANDSAIFVNPGLFKARMPFDTLKALQGVTMMASAPVILVVHTNVPAKNLGELLALARSKPGSLNYASGGSGTSTHLAGELMKQAAKVSIVHIPYKGTGPALIDLLAGTVHMQFAGISSVRQHVAAGRLRAIALTGTQRSPAMPAVPTFAENGLEVDADSYWGVYAPVAMPKDLVTQVSQALSQVLKNPATAQKLADLGYLPIANTPAEHTEQLSSMVRAWTEVVDKAGIQVE